MNPICKLFGHRRSKKAARRRGEDWLSNCSICKEPMSRTADGEWQIGSHELKP